MKPKGLVGISQVRGGDKWHFQRPESEPRLEVKGKLREEKRSKTGDVNRERTKKKLVCDHKELRLHLKNMERRRRE